MRDVFATAAAWLDEGRTFALATLVTLRESATAPIGTTIAVDDEGRIAGNIGAGCYEAQIVDTALRTATDGQTRRLDLNLTEDEILGGAGCGAMMQVVTWRAERAFHDDARAIAEGHRNVRVSFDYENVHGSPATFDYVYPAKATLIVVGATTLAAELAAIARRMDFKVVVVDPRPAFATAERVPVRMPSCANGRMIIWAAR